ncbi:winged helix-turn-helix domain-containing protein [Sphingomonas astaxanthinifaciens]|uniref:winged helix-turn-helix domain-containing protein n=2 Tax=Sphingomonas astaxanthinifaciens TaxID=407019 RepID=UPI0012EB7C06|nr:winged helix-turn-helix domain-containing protein [Sphingomonas astaxanthinifaciens]
MSNAVMRLGSVVIDPAERRLAVDGTPVTVTARYFDALLLLARHPGQLITKDRFHAEVWQMMPITDEALTQCIRVLRKALGDEAARPRFIETVPRYGYRWIGPADASRPSATPERAPSAARPSRFAALCAAGLGGGAAAGLAGGLGYGLLAASAPPPGTGAISLVLVMTCLCLVVGLLGGGGIGLGAALGDRLGPGTLFALLAGTAAGGFVTGTLGRLVGLDAFALLTGTRPAAITGGAEGLVVGLFAGLAAFTALHRPAVPARTLLGLGAAMGLAAGLIIALLGGRLMAGSLAGLAALYPDAPLGGLLSGGLAPPWSLVCAGVEGAVLTAALTLAFRRAAETAP